MKYCKKCNSQLTSDNTLSNDKRFCTNCAAERRAFIIGRKLALVSLRSLPLECKILKTKRMIQEAISEFGIEHVYISYSGGKDSTVLSHIAKQMYPSILHIFSNTTNEYPETIEHVYWEINFNNTNLITVLPKDAKGNVWTFQKVVEYYGYPLFSKRIANAIRTYRNAKSERTKNNSIDYINRNFKKYSKYKELNISDRCCDKLKKDPLRKKARELNLDCSIIGLLASESRQRELEWLNYGCNVFHIKKDNQCRPLAFWTEQDIYDYIDQYQVKISKLYSMGYNRNGCMYCGFGIHLEPDGMNRYQRLAKTHPIQYSYLINNFGDFLLELEIAL